MSPHHLIIPPFLESPPMVISTKNRRRGATLNQRLYMYSNVGVPNSPNSGGHRARILVLLILVCSARLVARLESCVTPALRRTLHACHWAWGRAWRRYALLGRYPCLRLHDHRDLLWQRTGYRPT